MASNDREDRPPQTPRDDGAGSIREQVLRAELLKLKLAYKDDVDSLGAQIDALNAQIATLGERERQLVASLGAQIDALNAQIASLGERERQIVASLGERERQIDHLNRVVAERDAIVRALYASWSWKLSAPVRVASRLAKSIVQGQTQLEPHPVETPLSVDTGAERTVHADGGSQPATPQDPTVPPASPATAASDPAEAPLSADTGAERTVQADGGSQPATPRDATVPPASPAMAAPTQDSAGLWSRFSSGPSPIEASRKVFVAIDRWPPSRQSSAEARLNLFLDFFAQSKRPVILASLVQPAEHPEQASASEPTPAKTLDIENSTSCSVSGLREVDDLLAAVGGELQCALLIGADTADALLPLVRLHCPWTRVIVDLGDSPIRNSRQEPIGAAKAEIERRQAIDVRVAGDADLVLALTNLDKVALLTHSPDAVIEVLPTPIDMPRADVPSVAARSQVIYIADPKMADSAALDWLVEFVWPAVRSEIADATLKVIGADQREGSGASTAGPGVEVVESAPDLNTILLHARVLVAPAQTHDSASMTAIQGLACGVPLVTTPAVADRLGGRDDVNVLVADDPGLFAQHIVRLLRDDLLWTRIHMNALILAQARFSAEATRKTIDGLFNA